VDLHNLGSTGLRGWIYTKAASFFDSCQGRTTTASRQILVTHVGAKSPADGVMQVDDVILGAGGKPFTDDARKSIAVAIQDAEKEANRGILKLIRWRAGKTEEVQLKLRVMGTYSDAAPYDCPKSKRILDEACNALEKEPLTVGIWGAVNGLALMAAGNPDYLPRVRDLARKMAPPTLKLERRGFGTWETGHRALFLCEYCRLTYAPPLKKLCITGRDADQANWLSKRDVAEAMASGRFDLDRKQRSPRQLVAAFGDWSPIVRGWAAEELASRPEAKDMVPQLIAMAEGSDAHIGQGACEALGHLKSAEALPALIRLLTHEDRWLRFKAAQAIRKMGGVARPALPDILKAVAQTAEPLQPINWADPIQLTHGQLAAALFRGPLAHALKEADPKLLYPAIRAVASNADGMARATLRGFFENRLTLEDVQALAPDILAAAKTPCPADTMFRNEIRMGAFKALTKYHFKEGIEVGVLFAKTQGGHGSESRTGVIMKEIMSYGSAAREALPGLRELIVFLNEQCKRREFPAGELNDRRIAAVEEAIKAIGAAKDHPELRSIAPAPHQGGSRK